MIHPWIPTDKIQTILQIETFFVAWTIFGFARFLYQWLLKEISSERHHNLKKRFFKTFLYLSFASILTSIFWLVFEVFASDEKILKINSYLGLVSLLFAAVSCIRLSQILIYIYLFYSHINMAVPRLIANMFTAFVTLIITSWLASFVFGIQLTTLLATSAVFSVILGLALQDTLGNLLAGVGLQIDKPYQIGDWIEVQSGTTKWVGQVTEITWRATFLVGFMDELILVPNRTIAQSQVIIYNHKKLPRIAQAFYLKHSAPHDKAKEIILASLLTISDVLQAPPPRVLFTEITESWVTAKVFYTINDYGLRYRINDKVIFETLKLLTSAGIAVANTRIEIQHSS